MNAGPAAAGLRVQHAEQLAQEGGRPPELATQISDLDDDLTASLSASAA